MSELILTEANFDQTISSSALPVLVDFWAPWCGPCRVMGPFIEELAKEWEGKALVGKVNVDDHGALAMKYNILSIPTFIVFKGGKVAAQFSGSMPKEDFKARVAPLL
mgnify:CR=1 FL=1